MKTSLQRYIENSNFLIGEEYTKYYINYISDILHSKNFYLLNCELPLIIKKYKDSDGILRIREDCLLTIAADSFPKDTYWVSFHSDWRTQSGRFVVHKGTTIVCITRDPNKVRAYLNLPI